MSPTAEVLVIEDDPSVTRLLEEVLGHAGLTTTVAADGLEGLVRLRTAAPDVVLLDLMMPDVGGLRVLEQLLEEGGGAPPIPVIVVTGSPEGASRSRELLGDADVFEKPFEPDALLARVRAHCGIGDEPGAGGGP